MEYAALVALYERLGATDSTLEKRDVLARAFASADETHLPLLVTLVRGELFPAWEGTDIGVSSSLTTEAIATATGRETKAIEARWREAGDLGSAAAWACEHATQRSLFTTSLSVRAVYDGLRDLAAYEGAGSQRRRIDAIAGLLSNASPKEAKYITRTALSHLRIGVGEGLVRDAIAAAFLVDVGSGEANTGEFENASSAVERAFQVTNDYPLVARTAKESGTEGLDALDIERFRPLGVMLAETATDLESGIETVAEERPAVLLEYKYDGARIQIHKDGETVRVFTRRLEEITEAFPEIRRAVRERVDANGCILDGEAIGYDPETEQPVTFQRFSKRIKRKHDIEALATEIPAVVFCFDLLALDGESLLDDPLADRLASLDGVLDTDGSAAETTGEGNANGAIDGSRTLRRADNHRYQDLESAEAFYRAALQAGHEGVMLKNLTAPYQPGRRVGTMTKAKPTMETLDLVVTRAQYSEGRRSDFLGRLFLACVDDREATSGNGEARVNDRFSEVGRLATGYTDEELRELTDRLEGLLGERDGRVFGVEPEVVLEIEYEAIQSSPTYDSGFALRFPRFLGVREDLGPAEADPFSRIEALFENQ